MAKVIRIAATGGPEVMRLENGDIGKPGPGQVRLRQTAVGVNFIDVYFRTGLYAQPLPGFIGREAAGVVEEVGSGVTDLAAGTRVAYCGGSLGAYCDERIMPAAELVPLPDSVPDDTAAAAMLKGLTVQYLFRQTHVLQPGEVFLFHAAAGGVGLIACQWAKAIGAVMIGTVGSEEKAAVAKAHGCAHVINYRTENFVERVKKITDGKGVDVAYDSVGQDTFPATLDCIARRGLWVSFGNASGAVPPFPMTLLMQKGSLFATRPTLADYAVTRADRLSMCAELFSLIGSGAIKAAPANRFALADAAEAHKALESRQLTGATILVP